MEPMSFVLVLVILLVTTALLLRQGQVTTKVPARYESIRALMSLLGQFVRRARLGEREAFECRLALDEACVNIIEHAYDNDPFGEIMVSLEAAPGKCTICLTDFGHPFDPRSVPPPARGVGLDEMRPGGLGLALMRQMMDEVEYTVGPEGNSLLMVKRQAD